MSVTIIIPCFNEADRLSLSGIETLCGADDIDLLLVNDGSTDATWQKLLHLQALHGDRVKLLDMSRNSGKGEAVRSGMQVAIEQGATEVGYLDADFATSAAEMLRLNDVLQSNPDCQVLLAARWLHLGANIKRSMVRHYTGRVFATIASVMLKMPVYDTQCGAKLFRVTDNLRAAIESPFLSRWIFDVELIGRLKVGTLAGQGYHMKEFLEVPLNSWQDIAGSKLRPVDFLTVAIETLRLWRALIRFRLKH